MVLAAIVVEAMCARGGGRASIQGATTERGQEWTEEGESAWTSSVCG